MEQVGIKRDQCFNEKKKTGRRLSKGKYKKMVNGSDRRCKALQLSPWGFNVSKKYHWIGFPLIILDRKFSYINFYKKISKEKDFKKTRLISRC